MLARTQLSGSFIKRLCIIGIYTEARSLNNRHRKEKSRRPKNIVLEFISTKWILEMDCVRCKDEKKESAADISALYVLERHFAAYILLVFERVKHLLK